MSVMPIVNERFALDGSKRVRWLMPLWFIASA
jgi:hypothetical protein